MWTMMLAAALLAQPADALTVTGVVVDPAGKPVSNVEIVLAARRLADGATPTLARSMTDDRGAFRLEVNQQRLTGIGPVRVLWAYHLGQTIAIQRTELMGNGALPPVRLTLAAPLKRTLTILDADSRPLAGVRLAPLLFSINGRALFLTPDAWLERLTVATGADGAAILSYLPATADPLRIRVTAPGIVTHDFPLPDRPGSDRFTLKLGRPARLAGAVTNDSGQPAANIPIEVWVETMAYENSAPDETPKPRGLLPSRIHFDSEPIRTRADGTFVTPPQLMTGWSYRIIIHPDGDPPVSSDSMTANTELTTFPPLRLQQRRKLVGRVHDREGKPVAGARVFLPSGEPTTTTDAQGRFGLEGIFPARTYLLVQAEGFQLQGWPGIPARQPEEREIVLVRTSEPSDRTMAPLLAPIPMEESRALARRVLEPSLQAALEKGDDNARLHCLRSLSQVDPARALELLEKHPFQIPGRDAGLSYRIATELLATDPVEAESIIAAIASPQDRALGYVWLAEALPAADRDRKRGLLEHATVQVHAPAGGERGANSQNRLYPLARVAGGWLNLGEVEKGRPLIREGLDMVAALPAAQRYKIGFLPTAARLELDRVLSIIRDLSNARRQICYVEIAEALATDHPAEAERVFQLIDDRSYVPPYQRKNRIVLRLCRPMAKTDPERVRRLIAGLKNPREQACAWAILAHTLADRDKPAARTALAESIRLIDRLDGLPNIAERAIDQLAVAINPSASILPIVEIVAPERLEHVFWKAVANVPTDGRARAAGLANALVAQSAIFLARYDRQVADVFVTQALASQSRSRSRISFPMVVRAKVGVDPRGAVAMIEAMPPIGPNDLKIARLLGNEAQEELVTCLVEPIEEHWKAVWRDSGIDLDEPRSR